MVMIFLVHVSMIALVDYALEQSFIKQNLKSGFRTIGIWPLNPKAMDNKTKPLEV